MVETSSEGLVSHLDTVLSMGLTIVYNVPSLTGQDIPPRVVHMLAQSPNFASIKEWKLSGSRVYWEENCRMEQEG
ncbi:hypothetical protein C1H46_035038 [Malus baccata]|uniref:Uncharacterized protein n=1 Tax=Malus baccata TaxID=106549 RepID=A0A540KYW3_MALBA|nr:hypothetical protein C1H46_035038 [Malus baccata]